MQESPRTPLSTPLGNVSPMDDQSNRKPREAQFKVTKKGAKRAACQVPQSCCREVLPPTKGLQAAPIQALFLTAKQVDGAATKEEFSSLAATYWWAFEVG